MSFSMRWFSNRYKFNYYQHNPWTKRALAMPCCDINLTFWLQTMRIVVHLKASTSVSADFTGRYFCNCSLSLQFQFV